MKKIFVIGAILASLIFACVVGAVIISAIPDEEKKPTATPHHMAERTPTDPPPDATDYAEFEILLATSTPDIDYGATIKALLPTKTPILTALEDILIKMRVAGYEFWEVEGEGFLWTSDDLHVRCAFARVDHAILCTVYVVGADMVRFGSDLALVFSAYGVPIDTLDAIAAGMLSGKSSVSGIEGGWSYSIETYLEDMSMTVAVFKQ